jgi:hypothetical protein
VLNFNASSNPQTFTITPTSQGAVTLTPTNGGGLTNPSSLSYIASGGVTTYMEDTFATGTAGTSLTGNAPHPTANGSDTWGDFTGIGFGAMGYAPGGVGATSLGLGGAGGAFALYALTGAPQDGTYTLKFTSSSTTPQATLHLHRDSGGANEIVITANYGGGAGASVILSTTVSGASSYGGSGAVTMATGVEHTLVATIAGSSLAITLDGTAVINTTIPTGTATGLFFGQSGGAAGDIVFNEIKVTSA